jgi:hypothetical protein
VRSRSGFSANGTLQCKRSNPKAIAERRLREAEVSIYHGFDQIESSRICETVNNLHNVSDPKCEPTEQPTSVFQIYSLVVESLSESRHYGTLLPFGQRTDFIRGSLNVAL